MKKVFAVILALSMTLGLVACSGASSSTPAASGDSAAPAQKQIVIRLGTVNEPAGILCQGAFKFEELAEKYSNGQVDVQVFPSGQLGSERDLFEGTSLGSIDMAVATTGPLSNFSSEFQVFDLPFLFENAPQAYAAMDSDVGQEILKSLEPKGMKALGYWDNGFRNLSNNKREIAVPADMKGIKLRTMENPIHMEIFKVLNALPTPMAWGEVYTGLEQGTIDGQENPLSVYYVNKFQEVQQYVSLTGHVYSPAVLVINKNTFESYPADIQEALIKAEQEARTWQREFTMSEEIRLVEEIRKEGVTVTEVDKAVWKEATKGVYETFKSKINQDVLAGMMK